MEVRLKAGCLLRLFGALDRVQRTHSSGRAGCSKSPRLMHGLSVGWHVTAFLCRALLRSGDPLLEGLLRRLFPSLSSSGAACGELSLAFCAEVRDRGGGGASTAGGTSLEDKRGPAGLGVLHVCEFCSEWSPAKEGS